MTRSDSTITLYCFLGLKELRLIYEAGMRMFPRGLADQPFLQVTQNLISVEQAARERSRQDEPYAQYILKFQVDPAFFAADTDTIFAGEFREIRIPIDRLDRLNRHLVGRIEIQEACFGPGFAGYIPDRFGMKGRSAAAQFALLAASLDYSTMDFHSEITANHLAVFLHYPFWARSDFRDAGIDRIKQERVLDAIQKVWLGAFPEIPLPALGPGALPGAPTQDLSAAQEKSVPARQVKPEENLATIITSLRRIQTEGSNISENAVIFVADEGKNYYIQFAAGHDDTPLNRDETSLYAEAVGNDVLADEFALRPDQVSQLMSTGWKAPSHSPNFYRVWKAVNDAERASIAREVMQVFTGIYGVDAHQQLVVELFIDE